MLALQFKYIDDMLWHHLITVSCFYKAKKALLITPDSSLKRGRFLTRNNPRHGLSGSFTIFTCGKLWLVVVGKLSDQLKP